MRVILLVRGSLAMGGSFHGSTAPTSSISVGGGSGTAAGHFHSGQLSGVSGRPIGSKRTAPGGFGSGAVNKFSQQPTFAITRNSGEVVDQGEDDEVKKVPVDVADDVDARVWNVDKAESDERGHKEAWKA